MRKTSLAAVLFAATAFVTAHAQQGPTDPQIAHIVVTANQVDIDADKLAEKKGSSKDVLAFGKQMVTEHTAVNKEATALVNKYGPCPRPPGMARAMRRPGHRHAVRRYPRQPQVGRCRRNA